MLARVVAALVTTIGFVAAAVGLFQAFAPVTPNEDKWLLERTGASLELPAPTSLGDLVEGDRIHVVGEVQLAPGTVVVANELSLDPGARLVGPSFTVIATRVSGGEINASGLTGASPSAAGESGGRGSDGGSVTLAVARVMGTPALS